MQPQKKKKAEKNLKELDMSGDTMLSPHDTTKGAVTRAFLSGPAAVGS